MIPAHIMEAARGDVHPLPQAEKLTPIMSGEIVVGFYRLRETGYGRCIGSVFVHPDYRRRGHALAAYAAIDGTLVACVRDDNVASIHLHERALFARWRRYQWGWWWRRS
jgi:GNAT superfamily N-acetyltransferase